MNLLRKIFGKQEVKPILPPVDISLIKADMHAHLLPGIDDGSKSLEDSLAMIKALKGQGYQKLLATPHVMYDFYKNPTDQILSKLDETRNFMKLHGEEIEIEASAEYYFDEELTERLKNKDILSFGKENYLLFEFSYFNEHQGVHEVLSEMFSKGYTPILAHPERYPYFVAQLEKYNELKEMGVKFQLNLMSLVGHYGDSAVHGSNYLIDNGFVDFIGTDTHRMSHIPEIEKALKSERLHHLISTGSLLNHTLV